MLVESIAAMMVVHGGVATGPGRRLRVREGIGGIVVEAGAIRGRRVRIAPVCRHPRSDLVRGGLHGARGIVLDGGDAAGRGLQHRQLAPVVAEAGHPGVPRGYIGGVGCRGLWRERRSSRRRRDLRIWVKPRASANAGSR